MKRLILAIILVGCIVTPALAHPTIEFNPDNIAAGSAGAWQWNGPTSTFHFTQDIFVVRANNSAAGDTLIGYGTVYIPDLVVSGQPGPSYTLTPASNTIRIKDPSGTTDLMTGTLGLGNYFPSGGVALFYTPIQIDISNIVLTPAGSALGSIALNQLALAGQADWNLSLQGDTDMEAMVNNPNAIATGGFSGSMTAVVPEPGTIALLGFGALSLLNRRKK